MKTAGITTVILIAIIIFIIISKKKKNNDYNEVFEEKKNIKDENINTDVGVSPNQKTKFVYVAEHSNKYHEKSCGFYRDTMIEFILEDAVKNGFIPCKVCHTK